MSNKKKKRPVHRPSAPKTPFQKNLRILWVTDPWDTLDHSNDTTLRIAQDRLTYWTGVGAQASPTVDRLIKQAAKTAA